MKPTAELFFLTLTALLTGLMWAPYILARIRTRGLLVTMGNPVLGVAPEAEPEWSRRARLAHANAIENLAVFAPLVLVAALLGISTPATVFATKLYMAARVAHYLVYSAGIPVVRTLAFFAGVAAMLIFAFTLLSHLA
ncbi:MAPEG family protein [Pseudomonas sp. SWI6]|uniref:MAPEG family protein n=1 Tax=Pseudomonas TaxID=286 RepID=UPI0006280EA8|nr:MULTISPECIES: MAPEG family protein [Pseudomonas]AVD83765.1 MAPEG family protein [Pseudomonas sp. SWI6]AVD85915.1 MAPEG family protein [Pseudomonas sp. SWI44]KKO16818.1 membrane protein [Pseudomonas putida KG-4]MDT8923738.1 MAPEG family protein [Pseudomonas taiwanensis]MPS99538.1 MAPEG family protein [Pseudomonas sp.]